MTNATDNWLRSFAGAVHEDLRVRGSFGIRLNGRSSLKPFQTDTGGWWVEIGRLSRIPSVTLEFWLDLYADGVHAKLWYGAGAKASTQVERLAKSLERSRDQQLLHVTDRDLASAGFAKLRDPLTRASYDRPILSVHDVSGIGYYEWHIPPFTRELHRERVRHVSDFFRLLSSNALSLGPLKGSRQAQRRSTSVVNRAVEKESMRQAALLYRQLGYKVENVCGVQSYDLRCSKGNENRFVEVKGSTSDAQTLSFTSGEIDLSFALSNYDLVIVHSLTVKVDGKNATASGGRLIIKRNWAPKRSDLTPTTFEWRRKRKS